MGAGKSKIITNWESIPWTKIHRFFYIDFFSPLANCIV